MEQDFIQFLSDIKYTNHTAKVYLWQLKKFADKNGYKNLAELADDVFILLDQGKHGDRKFDTDRLDEIEKHRNILMLFNSFLFDIGYRRDFVVPCYANMNFVKFLTTLREPTKDLPRIVGDSEDPNRHLFPVSEVADFLYVKERALRYRATCSGKKPRPIYQGRNVFYRDTDLNEFFAEQFPKKVY